MAGKWMADIKKTIYYFNRNGVLNTWHAVLERLQEKRTRTPYIYEKPSEEKLKAQREDAERLYRAGEGTFAFSILVPLYRTDPAFLQEMIESVQNQTYPYWELILADATEDDSLEKLVEQYHPVRVATEEKPFSGEIPFGSIVYTHLEENKGISGNTNRALALAGKSYTALLDHDDVLTADALYEMASGLERSFAQTGFLPGMIYSDEDKWSGGEDYYDPAIKEDFNLDYLLSNNYICHFLAMETGLMKGLGLRKDYDGAQDYDLILRGVQELLQTPGGEGRIVHVSRVLYHWRCHRGSTAENPQSKLYAYEAGRAALQDYADRAGYRAEAVHLKHLGFYRLQYHGSIFESRADLGAVGGRVLRRGKLVGGRMDLDGKVHYRGLPSYYSGYHHMAALTQDAEALDLRMISVSPKCVDLFEQAVGVPYQVKPGTNYFDISILPKGADIPALSIALGQTLTRAGYRLLWDPQLGDVKISG